MKRIRVLLSCILYITAINVLHAASITGDRFISVRAGGSGSTQTAEYYAYHGEGESGDFVWTETSYVSNLTVTITPSTVSPYRYATLRVTANDSLPAGSYSISVNAYPQTGVAATWPVTITVIEQLGTILPQTLPRGKESKPVNIQFTVSSGSGNYKWELSGAPTGVTIDSSTGVLSGTPAPGTAGFYTLKITVTDNTAPIVSKEVSIPWEILAYSQLSNEGQICYVADIVRDANGDITQTGNLFIKDLASGVERQITKYVSPKGVILNPMFTPDGSKILYTYSPDPETENFRIYLASRQSTIFKPTQALILKSNNTEAIPSTYNTKYAAISPDYDGTRGLLVFTVEQADRTQLYTYNFSTGSLTSIIRSEQGLEIRHPVFIYSSTIAFLGIKNNVQNIYVMSVDAAIYKQLTNNMSTTPRYGRLQGSWRNAG
ncbi:MAG TPA: putative Ig domain-containing protein, partial [bacterium]|nr:putative Ig domain-containing protein [bacterium]